MITTLVVGGGSIGKRHLKNLLASGRSAGVVETREDRRAEIASRLPAVRIFASLDEALGAERFETGFICVPTASHMPPALLLAKAGAHIFMEKPVSHSLDGIPELLEALQSRSLVGMTGFCMRFFQPLQKAKALLEAGAVGRIVTARSFTGVYLPDWHPYEDYRSFYMAKKEQGGGVLLDECHAFDWMQWLCGPIEGLVSVVATLSDLEVTTDDVCETIVRFQGGAVGSIHLDMVDRSARSEVEIIGTRSTLLVDLEGHTVRLYDHAARTWETWSFEPAYDRMYVDELEHFFGCVARREPPQVDLAAGYRVQRAHPRRLRPLQRLGPLGHGGLSGHDPLRAGLDPVVGVWGWLGEAQPQASQADMETPDRSGCDDHAVAPAQAQLTCPRRASSPASTSRPRTSSRGSGWRDCA
ncbi:MAG: Gfo/Idh/MocA family oxidoreductase [Candidatus Rokubacteria bacterium]|nr:Gfo/Idh/MocA family oxidoreductase [Candidatus Rokubacteria bacterium]